jgi:hypothetical protein
MYFNFFNFFLLACNPACTGAKRECKDGDCVCEDGFQDIDDDGDCEKSRKITDIEKNTLYYLQLFLLLAFIPRTVFSVKPQNGSKKFIKSTF